MVYGRVEVLLHGYLTSTLGVGEWSVSCPSDFYHRGYSQRYQLCRRLGRSQSPSGRYGEGNTLSPLSEIKHPT